MKGTFRSLPIIALAMVVGRDLSAQDLRGAVFRAELVGLPIMDLWLGHLDLYVETQNEVNRPFVRELSNGVDTLWLTTTTPLANGIKRKTYEGLLWGGSSGSGTISSGFYFQIGYRIPGIVNFPNSEFTAIEVQATAQNHFVAPLVNHPIVFNHQTNVQASGGVYTWFPNLWDPDGDSLSVELVPCAGFGYSMPPNTSIDPLTGTLTTAPATPGKYAYCARIRKWRTIFPGTSLNMGYTFFEITINANSVVGVGEGGDMSTFSAWPNPSGGLLHLELPPTMKATRMRVADMTGRVVMEGAVPIDSAVDVSALGAGCYTLLLMDARGGAAGHARFVKE